MTPIVPDRLSSLDTLVIGNGSHDPGNGTCAMEAVAWLAGEPHTDHPSCVCPAIGEFVRSWNDSLPDDASRARLLRPLLPDLIGTNTSLADTDTRAWMGFDYLVREFTPAWLDLVPALKEHAIALRALPEITKDTPMDALRAVGLVCGAAETAASAAWRAAWRAAWSAAWSAAESAAWSAARSAAESAAKSAAWSAARSAARSAAESAAKSAAADTLKPVVATLQDRAVALLRRMAAVGRIAEVKEAPRVV